MVKDARGHLHDALGRFARTGAKKVRATEFDDRPGNRAPIMRRGIGAFVPPTPSAGQRAAKEVVPARVRALDATYAKRARGERLTWRESNQIEWSSPRQIAEQRAKTGDIVKPRSDAVRGVRSNARSTDNYRTPRTGITRTFTGKARVERGNFRELLVPIPGRPDSMQVKVESRVRRSFDWPTSGRARTRMAPKPSAPKRTAKDFLLMSDARVREIATGMGITLPKRAGRNQIIKLITGAS